MGLFTEQDSVRFWSKVNKTDTCWLWQGTINHTGYPHFWLKPKMQSAHRVSYGLAKGPIPPGLEIDHLCRVTNCVNPDHLEAVTPRVNSLRSESPLAIHARKTHCIRGHEFTEENTYHPPTGGRYCRTCQAITNKAYKQRRRERWAI